MSKFKLKYGTKPNITRYIDNEVQRFLNNDRLTEKNLVQLDDKIAREAEIRDKKDAIVQDRQSERALSQTSKRSNLTGANLATFNAGNASQRSKIASQAGSLRSKRSKSSYAGSRRPITAAPSKFLNFNFKLGSTVSSSIAPPTEVYSEINEKDEWAAIQKFNTMLHFEETKAA